MTQTSLLLQALAGQPTPRPPFWFMRQAGRYLPEYRRVREEAGGFLDLCFDPARASQVTLQPVTRFATDAAILFSDILVVPHALGQKVQFETGEGPRLTPVTNAEELVGEDFFPRIAPVMETVRLVRAALASDTALIGFAGGVWTVAAYMVEGRGSKDFAAARLLAYQDPARFAGLIDRLVAATTDYLDRQVQAGADCVQIFDSWAGLLAHDQLAKLVIEPTARIVEGLRARHPALPIIGFPKGLAVGALEGFVRETGVSALGCDFTVPLDAMAGLQRHVCVQGNLDPLRVVAGGPAMLAAARAIIERLGAGPFIFNLGHGFVPQTPPEHVAALAALLRKAGQAG